MVKFNNKKQAFTVVEILLTMSILGFIFLMTMLNMRKQLPDLHKARYKKAYITIEKTVALLINDDDLYPSLFTGFRYIRPAVTEFGENIGSPTNINALDKFRDAFKFEVDAIKDNFSCYCYGGTCSDCFMTDDGVVYGIPDTDFKDVNMSENKYLAYTGEVQGKYLPITIYTDFEKTKKENTQEMDAMYVGVQYDGKIAIFHPAKCSASNKHRYCNAEEYLLSDTIKKKGK